MRHLFIVLVALFAVGDCRKHRTDNGKVTSNCMNKDVDAYLDKVLEEARQELPDPMRLPPRSTFVELSDGLVWGLSDLRRIGKAKVACEGEKVTIEAKLTTDELKARYTWTKERKNKDPREGYVVIISDDFEADIILVIDHQKNQVTHPILEKFVIQRFKEVKVEMTGMGYFTWALGEMTTLLSGIFQRSIAATIQDPIKEALEKQMKEIDLD